MYYSKEELVEINKKHKDSYNAINNVHVNGEDINLRSIYYWSLTYCGVRTSFPDISTTKPDLSGYDNSASDGSVDFNRYVLDR